MITMSRQEPTETFQLIRAFSDHATEGGNEVSDVVRAVRDHANHEHETEASRLRRYFNDDKLSSDIDIGKLDVEADRLKAALKTFDQTSNRSSWGLSNLKNIVRNEKETWENKSRVASGKLQEKFHLSMGKINTHASLLAMLPGDDKYFSIVVGALKVLTKASAEHRKTSEKLKQALIEINDEVEACTTNCELIRSEMMKKAVAKFYIEVFLFYADAIEWYKSSSLRKIGHSLQENFSDRFKTPLERIKRLSELVSRAAQAGQGAEITHLRNQIENFHEKYRSDVGDLQNALTTIQNDVRAGLEGPRRVLEEDRHQKEILQGQQLEWDAEQKQLRNSAKTQQLQDELWKRIGASGTSFLQTEIQNFSYDDRLLAVERIPGNDPSIAGDTTPLKTDGDDAATPDPMAPPKQLDTAEVQLLSARLCNYIARGVLLPDIEPTAGFAGDWRVVTALEDWMMSATSRLLCVEGPYSTYQESEISKGAAQIVWNSADLGLPTIAFFCTIDPDPSSPSEDKASGFLGLVYSLIHQLICLWAPISKDGQSLDLHVLESLDASEESWAPALDLLHNLLQSAPPLLLCVIDGIQEFEDTSSHHAADLISILRSAMGVQDKIFKVLFTTSGFAPTLLSELEDRELERFEISGVAGLSGPGTMTMRANLL